MERRFKEARKKTGMTAIEAANKLEVSQPTISAWEAGRKTPSIEGLERMADLYQVTTDYLLGRPEPVSVSPSLMLNPSLLHVFDGRPVWSDKHGWVLINAAKQCVVCKDGREFPFADATHLYVSPQHLTLPPLPQSDPLSRLEIQSMREVWVEPISTDQTLREELRGWYQVKDIFVENSMGCRFRLDCYGARWLAFEFQIK